MRGIFKKMMAAVAAVCMCAGLVMPMRATAEESIVYGDVNNDGVVSMADLTSLNKYLAGMIEIVNYEEADVTGNYVINVIDSKVLQAYLMQSISGDLPYVISSERLTVSDLEEAE